VSIVTLHFRSPRTAPACAVCGAKLTRGGRDRWWLSNTWTDLRGHFTISSTHTPGEIARPCGQLPGTAPGGA
jgi:hypothetical protein